VTADFPAAVTVRSLLWWYHLDPPSLRHRGRWHDWLLCVDWRGSSRQLALSTRPIGSGCGIGCRMVVEPAESPFSRDLRGIHLPRAAAAWQHGATNRRTERVHSVFLDEVAGAVRFFAHDTVVSNERAKWAQNFTLADGRVLRRLGLSFPFPFPGGIAFEAVASWLHQPPGPPQRQGGLHLSRRSSARWN